MGAANAAKNRRDVREASTRRHDTRRVPSRAAVPGAVDAPGAPLSPCGRTARAPPRRRPGQRHAGKLAPSL
ncbi:hypothetical protein BVI1335_1250038 [Burkholderia vietnamiensis]|nr:hypothetical protein BVI1335_1250038 [Burkholderia vietnamiensis]